MLAARPFVAAGEATLVPTASNIILARVSERFKAGALGLFFAGIPLGIGLSVVGAGIAPTHVRGQNDAAFQLASGLAFVGNLAACLGYLGAVVLLFHGRFRDWLAHLAPVAASFHPMLMSFADADRIRQVLGNLLSGRECDALIESARPALARSRTVETRTGGEEVNADRTSNGMFFQRGQTPEVTAVEQRIARLVGWPMENGEGLQVLHYRPGAEYKPHYDYFDPDEPGTPTILKRGGQRVALPLRQGGVRIVVGIITKNFKTL